VKSEVALDVMRLLNEAGVEIPFPQRDLRLRSVDATAAATLLSPNGSAEPCRADSDDLSRARSRSIIRQILREGFAAHGSAGLHILTLCDLGEAFVRLGECGVGGPTAESRVSKYLEGAHLNRLRKSRFQSV